MKKVVVYVIVFINILVNIFWKGILYLYYWDFLFSLVFVCYCLFEFIVDRMF